MSAPIILSPMAPVHDDVVNRDVSLTEAFKSLNHLGRSLVTLTALPVSHRPLRHDLRLSGKGTVTADDLVHIVAGDEVPVHLLAHLAPP